MEELIELLKDGKSRSLEMLADELNQPVENIKRSIEFLEKMGIIKKVDMNINTGGCNSCSGCSVKSKGAGTNENGSKDSQSKPQAACQGCMPEGGFQNMGTIWEVSERK